MDHFYRQKKAEVIERNENRVRIIDFGVSYNSLKGFAFSAGLTSRDSSIYGTPMSMPPEVYNSNIITNAKATVRKRLGKHTSSSVVSAAFNFGMSRDVWSLGVLLCGAVCCGEA